MNSRERVMQSVNHRQPDRVPLDFGGHRSSGMAVQAYKNLRDYLGLPQSPIYLYDIVQQLAVIEDDVLDFAGSDTVQLGYLAYRDPSYWKEFRMHDGSVVLIPRHIRLHSYPNGDNYIAGNLHDEICIQKKGCLYFEQTCFPYADDEDNEEFDDLDEKLEEIMWVSASSPPSPFSYDPEANNYLRKIARETRAHTDRAIYGIFGGNLLETGQQAFRMDNFLIEMAANPERVHKFLDKLTHRHMRNLEKYLDAVGNDIDVIGFSDDLGMQSGPQISRSMLDEFFIPRYAQMWGYIHKRFPEMRICLHCCGGVETFLTPLAKAGMDCLNPVQITCDGMDARSLKRDHGDEVTFWGGGCDTRSILGGDSIAAIEENVHANIEAFKQGGGFVFQQVHNILADVPAKNVVAMLEAVKKYGN